MLPFSCYNNFGALSWVYIFRNIRATFPRVRRMVSGHASVLGDCLSGQSLQPSHAGEEDFHTPEKNSSNSSIPPSQESIAARELRRTKSLRKPSGKPSGGQPGHEGHTLKTVAEPDRIIIHEPAYCKCCGRPLDNVEYRKIRKTQVIDLRFVVETSEEQYYEKVCQCGCVNNCDAPNCRIKYGDNIRALVTYLNDVQCIPFKRIAELISDLSGRKISEGTVQNILKENSAKSGGAYEEIRRRIECAPVVGADETGASVGKELH